MKQIAVHEFGGPEKLTLQEVPKPSAGEGQLVIQVEACGVNFADGLQRQDKNVVPTHLPYLPGYEVAGIVIELGQNVHNFSIGDRVVAMLPGSGGYAEYALIPSYLAAKIPQSISFQESLALQVQGLTAYLLLKDCAKLQKGQTVLIHAAAGGVGSLLVQIAKEMGAAQVIAAASTADKLAIARSLGADEVVNYSDPEWVNHVVDATHGQGVDLILNSTGGTILQQSFQCLAPFGKLIIYGKSGGTTSIDDPFLHFAMSNFSFQVFGLAGYFNKPELMQEAYQYLFSQAASGKLKVRIGQSFSLSEAAEAHKQIESRTTTGKVVLIP